MSFLHDKHTRWYCFFLLSLLVLFMLAGISIIEIQTKAAKEILFAHDNAVATSLLEQGVSEVTIATALTSKEESTSGSEFLNLIGFSENMDTNRLSYVSSLRKSMLPSILSMGLLGSIILFSGTILFLRDREKLYRESEKTIRNYIDGNYAVHLPQTSDGTVYQMLSSVEQKNF